jgi:flagellar motor switch protein FliN
MSGVPESRTNVFVQTAKKVLLQIVSQFAGTQLECRELDSAPAAPVPSAEDNLLRVVFRGAGKLQGQLQWNCEKAMAVQCAQLLMSETLDPAVAYGPTQADGFLEFIRQVAGELAVAWKKEIASEAELVWQQAQTTDFVTKHPARFELTGGALKTLSFGLDLDAEFIAGLEAAQSAAADATVNEEVAAKERTTTSDEVPALGKHSSAAIPSNLALILDVQLDATIRFGEREMLLQDVFGLMPGAIVELNQLVSEPADLLVAGRLVAKGEVVVVDGNFGLRVTEVLASNQRAAVMQLP